MKFYPAVSHSLKEDAVYHGWIGNVGNEPATWHDGYDDWQWFREELSDKASRGWRPKAVHAITDDGEIAGCFKFLIHKNTLWAQGTFVWEPWRKQGVGTFLWKTAIGLYKPKQVNVSVVSDRGLTLVDSLIREFPEIKFKVTQVGLRPLRTL